MMRRAILVLWITLISCSLASAQRRTTILGDAWTGEVISTDDRTREITIKYEEKGRIETFTGVLPESYLVKSKDGSSHDLKFSEIQIGTRVRMYCKGAEQEVAGKKVKIKKIRHIDFLGRDEYSTLRNSLNLEPSFVVTLAESEKIPIADPLKVYLAIEPSNIRARFLNWVNTWNKEEAAKYGALEIVAELSESDVVLVLYHGFDDMNIMFPFDSYDSGGNVVQRVMLSKATAYLAINASGGLKVLWKQGILIASDEKSETSSGKIEKEFGKRMKARLKK